MATTTSQAIRAAQRAAEEEFNAVLHHTRCTATQYVPPSVVSAAERAYAEAGGAGSVIVCGEGNTTHPVCSVRVKRA